MVWRGFMMVWYGGCGLKEGPVRHLRGDVHGGEVQALVEGEGPRRGLERLLRLRREMTGRNKPCIHMLGPDHNLADGDDDLNGPFGPEGSGVVFIAGIFNISKNEESSDMIAVILTSGCQEKLRIHIKALHP